MHVEGNWVRRSECPLEVAFDSWTSRLAFTIMSFPSSMDRGR